MLLLANLGLHAQNHAIQLLSWADSTVVPFATVMFESKNSGFHTNEQGRFSLSSKQMLDTIRIHSIGFQEMQLIIQKQDLKGEMRVYLIPKVYELAELKVYSGKKPYTSMKPIKKTGILLEPGGVGAQCGLLLTDPKLFFRQIQSAHFYISNIGNRHFPFRIRIYSVKQGKPEQEITQESIIVHAKHRGWNEFDLSRYHYFVPEGGCLVAMEWLNFEDNYNSTSNDKYEAQVLGLADYGKGYLGFQKTEYGSWNFNGDYLPHFTKTKMNMFLNPMIRLTVK